MTKAKKKNTVLRGRRPAGSLSGREAILGTAVHHFARSGFEATSLRAIARDAKVDMALAARIFGSKIDLWSAVLDFVALKRVPHNQEIVRLSKLNDTDPYLGMKQFITLYASFMYDVPEFQALYLNELSAGGERLEIIQKKLTAPMVRASFPIIKSAIAAGVLRAKDPKQFLRMLFFATAIPMVVLLSGERSNTAGIRLKKSLIDEAIANFLIEVHPSHKQVAG